MQNFVRMCAELGRRAHRQLDALRAQRVNHHAHRRPRVAPVFAHCRALAREGVVERLTDVAHRGDRHLAREPLEPLCRRALGKRAIEQFLQERAIRQPRREIREARVAARITSYNVCYTKLLRTWYLNAGAVTGRQPRSAHPSVVPSQLYTTRDGWIFVMCNKEKFWELLAGELGHLEWCADPRLADFAARLEHRALVQELLDAALSERTTAEWPVV